MVSYQVNGKIYDLPEEEVQGFLNEFPDAVIVEENETVEKPIPSPEESAPVEENAALDNTVSEPVDTSLELPTTYKVDGKIYDLPKEEVDGFLSVFTDAEPYEGKESIQELQKSQPNGEAVDGFWESLYVSFINSLDNIELQRQSAALI
jgi:hypothetical protein